MYVSEAPETGVRASAYGPTSNKRECKWKNEYRSPMHKYLNVMGGFLRAGVSLPNNKPPLSFHHYDVDGNIVNAEVWQINWQLAVAKQTS